MTQIGAKLTNPYTKPIIEEAYFNVYNERVNLKPNYLYVRFLPSSPDDVKKLLDMKAEFWDYPLDHEILQMGERYQDPSLTNTDFTWQYTVVPVSTSIPSVTHEILQELVLVPEDTQLEEEAFRLTNNAYEKPNTYVDKPTLIDGKIQVELPKVPDNEMRDPGIPGTQCCNCAAPGHTRFPAGCVTVEDEMLNLDVCVRSVRVRTSKTKFLGSIFYKEVLTNQQGCYEIPHKYHGSLHMWVKFESPYCNIKTMNHAVDLWNYTFPRKTYIGKFWGPNFNNINVHFPRSANTGNPTYRNWVAATINNAVHETNDYFSLKEIPPLPGKLIILVTPWDSGEGSAPMLDKMFTPIEQVLGGLVAGAAIGSVFGLLPNVATAPIAVLSAWISVAAPDIVFNVSGTIAPNADDIKETAYHEFAHAAHFAKVGNAYWQANIQFVANNAINNNNPPYGTANNSPGADRCAVIESWGFMMGRHFAHLRYGPNHSNGPLGQWRRIIERSDFTSGYIPLGWQYDLIDVNNITAGPDNPFPELPFINDNVSGFTEANIWQTMTPFTTTLLQQRQQLQQILPANVNITQYNQLNDSYGW